ncbi:aspartate kinase [candidate division KSB1 bacterium]|nr:aspartate kinase [candidate division KSB1 bacterium]
MIALKIGGSSLKNLDSLDQVVRLIQEPAEGKKIVILSALSGVTDHLLKSVAQALQTDRRINGLLDYLQTLHREWIVQAIDSLPIRSKVLDETDYLLSRLEKLLYGIAYTGECTRRTRDLVVSMGERLAAHLLAACLTDRGTPAVGLEADKIGMIATGDFGNGNADLRQTEKKLPQTVVPLVEQGILPVITGFFGATPDNHTITFGRGGTDYSAAVVAAALNCRELQIWKDVDGFLTADPVIVPNAQPLYYLSYDEAAELSYFGAKILHPRTVEPLAWRNIPALIKNTYRPDAPGTRIGVEKRPHDGIIKSVTFNPRIGSLRLEGASIGQQVGFLHRVVSVLSDRDINIISVITSQTAVNLLLEKNDIVTSKAYIEAKQIPYIDNIEPVTDVALVGVVGEGLATTPGLAARVFSAVAESGTNVEMIVSGASQVAQYFIIKEADVVRTIQAIHREFFPVHEPGNGGVES